MRPFEERVRIIPLGFNPRFAAELPPRELARKLVDLPVDRQIVMQVARFEAIKGQMNLLDSLEELVRKGMGVIPLVVFIGGVLDPPSVEVLAYKAAVEKRSQSTALKDHVVFLGHREDVPLLMRAANVIVTPSDFESFSMTIIEAMMAGTPVVATNRGGPAEIIENGVTGILVPPRNPAALASAIHNLVTDAGLAGLLAGAAREAAFRRYKPGVRYERLVAEYKELVNGSALGVV